MSAEIACLKRQLADLIEFITTMSKWQNSMPVFYSGAPSAFRVDQHQQYQRLLMLIIGTCCHIRNC